MSDNFGMILRGGEFANDQRTEIGREFSIVESLAAAETAGGVVAIANPFGVAVIVTDAILGVTTESTAASTVDVGIAANATTSADNLIDGCDVGTAAGLFDNRVQNGTNGGMQAWGTTEYLTISKASGSVAGIVGKIYIKGIQSL